MTDLSTNPGYRKRRTKQTCCKYSPAGGQQKHYVNTNTGNHGRRGYFGACMMIMIFVCTVGLWNSTMATQQDASCYQLLRPTNNYSAPVEHFLADQLSVFSTIWKLDNPSLRDRSILTDSAMRNYDTWPIASTAHTHTHVFCSTGVCSLA